LASAYSRAERTDQAKRVLECIVEDKGALLNWPIPYIRSFFLLGREHRVLGDASNAQKYFQRFLRYWKDGELDSN
jgi:hypothetical protein